MNFDDLDDALADLDAILNEVKDFSPAEKESADTPQKSTDADGKNWSLDDIDRLLADTAPLDFATEKKPQAQKPEAQKPQPVKETRKFPGEDVPVSTYFKVPEPPAPKSILQREPAPTDVDVDEILKTALLSAEERENTGAKTEKAPAEPPVAPEKEVPVSREALAVEQLEKELEQEDTKQYIPAKKAKEKPDGDFVINIAAVTAPKKSGEEHIPDYDPLALYEEKKKKKPALHTDAVRESFLQAIVLEDEEEPEEDPTGIVETPGIVVEKSRIEATSELEPLPTVISADKARSNDRAGDKTLVANGHPSKPAPPQPPESEEFPGQIKLSGFGEDADATPVKVSEADLEQEVAEHKDDRLKDFTLKGTGEGAEWVATLPVVPPEKTGKIKKEEKSTKIPPTFAKVREYKMPAERHGVNSALKRAERGFTKQTLISLVFCAVLFLVNLMPALLEKASISSNLLGRGTPGFYVMNALLLIATITANNNIFAGGLAKLKNKSPDCDTAAALCALAAFLHNTVVAVAQSNTTGNQPVFALLAAFGFAAVNVAGALRAQRMVNNFEICAYKYQKSIPVIHPLKQEAEVRELSREMLMDKAELYYSSKTEFPADFVGNSSDSGYEQKTVGIGLPAAAVAAVITAAVCGVLQREWLTALSVFAGTFCLCTPVLAALVPAVTLWFANRQLNREGSVLTGADSAEKVSALNGIVVDAADIFDRAQCRMHGMIDFKKIRIDDVLVYAAALVIKSGGPLQEGFENVISQDATLLPTVKELVYEDKLGISARIRGQKVLLGNRSLLQNHGVEIPDPALEAKHTKAGRNVIYLAVDGNLAAMFAVSYKTDDSLKGYFARLEAAGTQILVRTNDVNVTREMLAAGFGLPKSAFGILSSVGGRVFMHRREEVTPAESVHLVHNGKTHSMLRLVAAAQRICKDLDILYVIQTVLCIAGAVGIAVLTGLGHARWLNGITASLYLLLSAGVCWLTSLLFGAKDE